MSRFDDRVNAPATTGVNPGPRMPVVAAVDVGASKISCFIMKADGVRRADRTVRVAGVGYVQARGVKGGAVVDLEQCAFAIAQAVERAERMAGVSIDSATLCTAYGGLASHRLKAEITLGARPITEHELRRANALAITQVAYPGRRAVHLLPISWSVDAQRHIQDPRGMSGQALGLDLLAVTANDAVLTNLIHCMELAHLQCDGVVASPLASALAALDDDEMDLGAICLDMGAGSTSAAVFSGGALVHVDSLSVGGGHVTADIARGLSTSLVGAERIKTLHGSAIASANEDREMIEAPPRGDDPGAGPVVAPRSILKGVIAPRIEETLELMRERLIASGAPIDRSAGVVLTGGASQLAGVREVAVRVFDRPVRLGRPRRAPHLADAAAGPAFCAAAGVLLRHAFGPREIISPRRIASGRVQPADALGAGRSNPVTRAFRWLKAELY